MIPLKILSTGVAVPAQRITSAELDAKLGFPDGSVQRRSGVIHRYHAGSSESQSELGAKALQAALARADIAPGSIDLLISACGVQEQALPGTAAHVLAASGLRAGTPAFDVGASCLSFLMALQVSASLLHSGAHKRIAIVASDLASRGIDWSHPEASLIFGDGAAAAIVETGDPATGIASCRFETYPEGRALCEIRAGGTRRNPAWASSRKTFISGWMASASSGWCPN